MRQLITIEEENCVNCHQCIAVCPVKYANNGSGEYVTINNNLCIGCGECIRACTHKARHYTDQLQDALTALKINTPTVAIAAPAVTSNFGAQALNLNGWLKRQGVEAIFDVSFGAELTTKSYLEYIVNKKPASVIAQPCPAIVCYIENYQPELLQWLAPVDSPMMHTIKMIREFYPKYSNHNIIVLSPCIAKEREFEDVTTGVFNVTIKSLQEYIDNNHIDLHNFDPIEYHLPQAGVAAGFSSPGGLLETVAERAPELRSQIRKIEGPHLTYDYLKKLPEQIKKGNAPLLVDILNCENGCNGGTGTCMQAYSPDELEVLINSRISTLKKKETHASDLQNNIEKHWIENLYNRIYINRSENFIKLKTPDKEELNKILLDMHKTKPEHKLNCAACGYNDCETMAKAIFNGLNRKENCHFYLQKEMEKVHNNLDQMVKERTAYANKQREEVIDIAEDLLNFMDRMHSIIDN